MSNDSRWVEVEPVLDRDYLRLLAEGSLSFQECLQCGNVWHPPGPICVRCGSSGWEWKASPPEGRVYSFTEVHPPSRKSEADLTRTHTILWVEFPNGPRVMGQLQDATSDLDVGDLVHLVSSQVGQNRYPVPTFKKVVK